MFFFYWAPFVDTHVPTPIVPCLADIKAFDEKTHNNICNTMCCRVFNTVNFCRIPLRYHFDEEMKSNTH